MSSDFGRFVAEHRAAGELVVQPRMGFSEPDRMRRGLLAVRHADAPTAGTITLDSYTRVNDHAAAGRHLRSGTPLNGYPLVAAGATATRAMVDGVAGPGFPIQVRHGSADPRAIVDTMLAAGLHATEGGPVSYCLPYGRTALRQSVAAWAAAAEALAERGCCHVETFGGCLLGQLCPPSLLVAVSLLEGLFFRARGVNSLSLSYAQQTSPSQDREAVAALRRLARRFLPGSDWHVVVYTYMGVFPSTPRGATGLLDESVRLAVESGAERLIVKTTAEARRIPTIAENVRALERAAALAGTVDRAEAGGDATHAEALTLIEAVLELDRHIDAALLKAFSRGVLDVPYCLHPDNRGEARSVITSDGRLEWAASGRMPLPRPPRAAAPPSAEALMRMLNHVATRFDGGRRA
jgi:methylaspartate mutase epsilon subunit